MKLLLYLPEIKEKTVLHFSSKGNSWKLRDYSIGRENVILSSQNSDKSVEDIRSEAKFETKANGKHPVSDVEFWKNEIEGINEQLTKIDTMQSEIEYHDPIDLAINNDLEILKERFEKSSHQDKIKYASLEFINDVLKIETIGKYDYKSAIVLARSVIEKILTDLCDENELKKADSIFGNIDLLYQHEIIPDKIKNYFHFIRLLGNIGVHDKSNDKSGFEPTDVIIVRMVTLHLLKWYFDQRNFR